ncbi:MAG TPA: endolytic transglycosylase MltG [Ferruginibacter sp.]|jgi:UPF0755 protein|nr:endolytic transglycosylase MltG [Ferruginibacter sp.]
MKKFLFFLFLIIIAFAAWFFLAPDTNFSDSKKALYIKTGSSFENVIDSVEQNNIVQVPIIFKYVAQIIGYDKNIKPGKYVIQNESSLFKIIRTLRSGSQTPVNLVIIKLRTREDLAQKIAANFECDSTTFINYITNSDSLSNYLLDTNTVMTAIIPNTYTMLWTTPASKIFKRLFNAQEKFWTSERKHKAAELSLTTKQAYTLASIVEEETTKDEDKGNIASVYLNRRNSGMKLSADPTIKFAMRDFGLKRIYDKYLLTPSPYNTYQHLGLPPGPICTPSIKTIDAVLNEPATNYLYFVAKPDWSGLSNFSATYGEHQVNARNYQRFLDSLTPNQ